MALVLTAIPSGLEENLWKWTGQDEWRLGLLAKTHLGSYGDHDLRHALFRRLLVEKDLPHTLSLPDWPYSLSTPSLYLRSNLSHFLSPMADDEVSRGLTVSVVPGVERPGGNALGRPRNPRHAKRRRQPESEDVPCVASQTG